MKPRPKSGDCFEMPKRGSDTPHLWILLTNPDERGLAVMVNITTKRPNSDCAVILKKGDHPYITHPSVVFYADAQITDTSLIESAIDTEHPQVIPCNSCSPEILRRIQQGLIISDFTPAKVIQFFRKTTGMK